MTNDATKPHPRSELLDVLLATALAAIPLAPIAAPATWWLLALWPGGFVMRASGVGAQWSGVGRFVLRVALSISVAPVVLNPLWHWTNDGRWLLGAFAALAIGVEVALVAITLRQRERSPAAPAQTIRLFDSRPVGRVFVLPMAFVALGVLATYWPDRTFRGEPLPSQIHDYIKHHGVLFSMQQRPLPLGNPFYVPYADGPAYYYHFFYLIPATVRAVSPGVSIALSFGVQAALVAIATAGMCAIVARRAFGGDGPALLAACLATVVGGLDAIPLALLRMPAITLDAWADTLVRVHNLLTQMVWTPQNVQGVLIVVVGAYLLGDPGRRWSLVIVGSLLIAGLVGSSVWVAAGTLPAAAIWTLIEVWRRRGEPTSAGRWFAGGLLAGVIALAASWPILRGYVEMSRRLGKGLTLSWEEHQAHALLGRFAPPGVLANLLDLPWILAVEFGALAMLPLLLPRARWKAACGDRGVRLLLSAAAVALVVFVTVRSHFRYNDFGQKVIMLAQIAGAIAGAGVLASEAGIRRWTNPVGWRLAPTARGSRPRRVSVIVGLLLLGGLPVALWQTPLAAVRRFFPDHGPLSRFTYEESRRARREAGALRYCREELPIGAVVLAHWGPQRLDMCQLIDRQIGATVLERDTMVFQVGTAEERAATIASLERYFAPPYQDTLAAAYLQTLGVTHVFVGVVERALWGDVGWLQNPRIFETVYQDDAAFVVRVRRIGEPSAE